MGLLEYSEITLDHFNNPRNVGVAGNYNGYGRVGDPGCGDVCEMTVRIQNDIIEDIKFRVYGCAGAIATSSAVTVLAMNKKINEALKLTDDEVVEFLGGLPEKKQHCSLLALKALRQAIYDHLLVYRRAVSEGRLKKENDYGSARKEILDGIEREGLRKP
ncbi:MAG: iron-sulfur cluster assembly scaffold protein [Peptococcaceae bacterium]|nr:iron-sulfur cluster assembly scaffold protein [Peptococcaceae bacterium]